MRVFREVDRDGFVPIGLPRGDGDGPMTSAKHVVAAAVIVWKDDRLLALRRSPHKVGAGLWEVVSGRIEVGEEPLECAMREVKEETSLEVSVDERPVATYAAKRGDEAMIVIVYRARWVDGEVELDHEHDEHRWVDVGAFDALSSLKPLVKAARRCR